VKSHFLISVSLKGVRRVFIGGVSELHCWVEVATHQTLASRPYTRPTSHPTQPSLTLGTAYPVHRPSLTCWQSGNWNGANTWLVGQPCYGSIGLGLCATSSPHVILSMTMPYFDILKICMDFGPYDAFPSSNVPEMVDQQNFWNSLVISTYLLYLAWNVGMLTVNICILWLPTLPSHLPILGFATGPYELAAAVTVLRHTLCTQ
jgi:hypothetical protein